MRRQMAIAALLAALFTGGTAAAATVTFDFDNAPVHTPLPLNLTVDGLTAQLSATGQSFSIQFANTMGFTPVGFGGLCIYPSSVFPADLVVQFSQTLTDFSIMFAPQELACDDTATMRATAYMDVALVGTATAQAPFYGTWPTGTLSISAPAGFNRVVVHYDARPPTCGDWGPIFMADNMIVNRVLPDCSGVNNCSGHGTCVGANVCSCDPGWSDPSCATPTCSGLTDCMGHGTCVGPDVCQCDANWAGLDCSISTIPAVSQWGLVALMLVLLSAGALLLRQRHAVDHRRHLPSIGVLL